MNVAIYARASTKAQSCDLQLSELRGWAARHGWTIAQEYIDHGVSGGKASRPALDRLMADAQAKRFDAVMVYKLDRFGRSVAHFTANLQRLDSWGIRFIATSQGIDTNRDSPTGRLLLHILAAVAEFEKALINERSALGIQTAIAAGKKLGAPRRVFRLDQARERRLTGASWTDLAREFQVPVSTLRGALRRG